MYLDHLALADFRNYASLDAGFDAHKVILLGENAQGKTNVLEAVALLATGKSPRANKDADLVRHDAEQAVVRVRAHRDDGSDLAIDMLLRRSGRRAVKVDGLGLTRLADMFGKLLVVSFRLEDLDLVKGAPAARRDFLDTLLVQLAGQHHARLAAYNRVVTQRNKLLAAIGEGRAGADELAGWDAQLVELAVLLWRRRRALVEALAPGVAAWHGRIAADREVLALAYAPSMPLDGDPMAWPGRLEEALAANRRAEIARGRTLVGPHKDDLVLTLDGHAARDFGSAGQQRTAVLALKLAELDHLREATGEAPLLLLDDVLAELDVRRQNALLAAIGEDVQAFVTTTHLNDFSAAWLAHARIVQVAGGRFG